MALDNNLDIQKIKYQPMDASTSVSVKPEQTSVQIPLTKNNNANADIYTKLGITENEYLKIIRENPDFVKMDFDAQLKFIQQKKNTNITQTPEPETSKQTTTAQTEDASSFNKKEYSRLNLNNKFTVYVTELAKNKFINGDAENKKTVEDWNKLSQEDQQKLINAERTVLESHSEELSRRNSKIWLDTSMTELQAANYYDMSIDKFQKSSQGIQSEIIYDYLNGQDEQNLSLLDKRQLSEMQLLCNAATYAAKSETHLCPEKAREYLINNKISPIKAEYAYLQSKTDNGVELTKFEQQKLELLHKIETSPAAQLAEKNFGTRTGETSKLSSGIASSEYGEIYEKANGKDRALILKEYLEKTYDKKDPKFNDIIGDLIVDAAECGDVQLIEDLYSLVPYSQPLRKKLANSDNRTINTTNALNFDKLGEDGQDFIRNRVANPDDPDNEILTQAAQTTCSTEQMVMVATETQNAPWQSVQNGNVEMKHRADNADVQVEISKIVKASGNQEAIELDATTADRNLPDAQMEVLSIATEGNEGATHAAISSGVSGRMAEEHQAASVRILMERNEEYTQDPKTAQEYSTQLADQVATLAASQQAEAHKYISQSKYSEVVQHAAENIYKYDESAQKDALKYTLKTGDPKAIESAISNIDKCKGLSNETAAVTSADKTYDAQLAKEIKLQQAKIEQKYVAEVAGQFADYMVEQDIRSGIISKDSAQTQREKYIEEFKTPSSNKFALLGKLEPGQKKEALKILVKFAPTLINSFIDMGYGEEILRVIGETSDLAEKIIKLMDFKGQPAAREIVMKHPDKFEDLYLKYAKHEENPPLAHTIYTTTPPEFTNFFKRFNSDGSTMFKV